MPRVVRLLPFFFPSVAFITFPVLSLPGNSIIFIELMHVASYHAEEPVAFFFSLSPADAEQVAAHSPQLEGSAVVLTCPGAVSEATVPVSTETTQGEFFCC